jgi:hypothetical protein
MVSLKKQELVRTLMTESGVQNVLGSARFDSGSLADLPSRGVREAKVTIQEFCDFQNPLCARSRIVLEELLKQYPDKLLWVFRHYPVDSNPLAKESALAWICGHKKDKFWPVHDALYDGQAAMTKDKLSNLSGLLSTDKKDFTDCIVSSDTAEILSRDVTAARNLDISSTPTFLVNGIKVTDFDELRKKVASEVLKR